MKSDREVQEEDGKKGDMNTETENLMPGPVRQYALVIGE